jgi:hypothetical protein
MSEVAPMTTEAFRPEINLPLGIWFSSAIKSAVAQAGKILAYSLVSILYLGIVISAMCTLGLIEIRQANLNDSNALIAVLEQKAQYLTSGYFDKMLADLANKIRTYRHPAACSDATAAGGSTPNRTAGVAANTDANNQSAEPSSCAAVTALGDQDFYKLEGLEQDLQLKRANLPNYYYQYTDGLRAKTPQLLPLLQFMDPPIPVLTWYIRLPVEVLNMFLLMFMGALGAIINIVRCFVEDGETNPTPRDLWYRPASGAVLAFGIYVVFVGMQMFFGGVSQNTTTMVSTSVFILAVLGLAAGVCAREAMACLEVLAGRVFRKLGSGGPDNGSGSDGDNRNVGAAKQDPSPV